MTAQILSITAIRNVTSAAILGYCNVTLSTGGLVCNNTYNATGYIDYNYEPDTYVRSGAARTILTLTILFFAIAILAVGIKYAWDALKENNLI